jgi:hypothetical protein
VSWPAGKWGGINRARARRAPGAATKPERLYAARLERLAAEGAVAGWMWKPIRFRLAERTFYEPDFMVVLADLEVAFDEVKGARGWELDDESRTKWKVAAEAHPMFRFRGAVLAKAGWEIEEYEPRAAFPAGPGLGVP